MENQPSSPLVATFEGHISTTTDALTLFEACLNGTLNHVPRRPHDRERQELIKSGNIFIYEEHASGIKRWTDGVSWSPSRILGNFLIYRELEKPFPPGEKKRALKKTKKAPQGISKPEPLTHTNLGYLTAGIDPSGVNRDQERSLIGSLVDSYPFKPDGLVKKTISITFQGVPHHLVSYYNVHDVVSGKLETPSKTPGLHHIIPRPELFLSQNWRTPVDEVEYAVQDHHNAQHTPYGSSSGHFTGSGSLIQRAMQHNGLGNAMNPGNQSSSSAGFMFSQHATATQDGYTTAIPNPNFPAAMQQQLPYASNPPGPYSVDNSKADRFASTASLHQEFPRNMPSAPTSRRESIYEHSVHQPEMHTMPFGSSNTEARAVMSNPYMAHHSGYVSQSRQTVSDAPPQPFPVARVVRPDSDGINSDSNIGHPYNMEENAVWNFEQLESNAEPQYFAGHAPGHVQWSNAPHSLPRA